MAAGDEPLGRAWDCVRKQQDRSCRQSVWVLTWGPARLQERRAGEATARGRRRAAEAARSLRVAAARAAKLARPPQLSARDPAIAHTFSTVYLDLCAAVWGPSGAQARVLRVTSLRQASMQVGSARRCETLPVLYSVYAV